MWKKLSKIVLAAMIFVSGVVLIPAINAQAVGADTVVKLVGGKAVVRAISEKAGVALSPKQLDNVIDLIEKKTYDGDSEVIEWVNKANLVKDTPSTTPSTKSGFKKYILEPAMWLTGADLIFDAIEAFKDGYEGNTPVDTYSQCVVSQVDNISIPAGYSYVQYWHPNNGYPYMHVYQTPNAGVTKNADGSWYLGLKSGYSSATYTSYSKSGSEWVLVGSANKTMSSSLTYVKEYYIVSMMEDERVCSKVPLSDDVGDVSNVSTSVVNSFDNDTYNNNTTYNLEIEMPDTVTTNNVNYGDTTVWNEKDSQMETEIVPTTPTDSNDDDGVGDAIDVLVRVDDPIPIHEKFFLEMADMGQKIEDMYNGVVHFFDTSIDGFTTLTSGMTGFVSFLDDFFDWLPSEYVALLGSGFTLGVVSFFLRR